MGCPRRCIYCSVDKLCLDLVKPDDLEDYVNEWLKLFNGNGERVEIAFYGGTFTNIPPRLMDSYLTEAEKFVKAGLVYGIRISTRPDYLDDDILEHLKERNVKVIEVGVESFDDEVLTRTNRGYDSKTAFEACERVKKYGIELGIHLMVGLPGDELKKDMETVRKTILLEPETVRIHPTLVLKNTELELMYRNGLYEPLSLDEAVDTVSEMFIGFAGYRIRVVRMGFFVPSDRISEVVAGPNHPSFGDMVKYVAFRKLVKWAFSRYGEVIVLIGEGKRWVINGYGGENGRILSNYMDRFKFVGGNEIRFILNDAMVDYRTLMKKYFREKYEMDHTLGRGRRDETR